jgi:hypothetical protein
MQQKVFQDYLMTTKNILRCAYYISKAQVKEFRFEHLNPQLL